MKKETLDKLIARHKNHIEEDYKKEKDEVVREKIQNEIDNLDKFGINAFACSCIFFRAGDLVRITVPLGEEIVRQEAKILIFGDDHVIFFDEKNDSIFQVKKYAIIMIELLDIADDDFYEFMQKETRLYDKIHDKGGNMHG